MKHIFLGCIGMCVILYTFLIGLDILMLQTSQNALDKHVSRIVQHVLETGYGSEDEELVEQLLMQEIEASVSTRGELFLEIQAMDLEKGLLSVRVSQKIKLLNGKTKELVVEKTAIVERSVWTVHEEVS